jgi:hypothetical protein
LILTALVAAAGLFGQDARGRISGKLTDPSGAPIPRATVDAIQDATQVKVSATTNDAGSYDLLYLDPGMYTLTVLAPGFQPYKHPGVEVRMTDRLTTPRRPTWVRSPTPGASSICRYRPETPRR